MTTYKEKSERTDADERALIPAIRRTRQSKPELPQDEDTLRWIATTLVNDEASDDQELREHFESGGDMSYEAAIFYVSQRNDALKHGLTFKLKPYTELDDCPSCGEHLEAGKPCACSRETPARTEIGKAQADLVGSPHESPDTTRRQAAQWWGAYDEGGNLRAKFDSETEAYFYTQTRAHMHGGNHKLTASERPAPNNNADKLAGALRNALNMIDPFVWDKSKESEILEAYDAAQINDQENQLKQERKNP